MQLKEKRDAAILELHKEGKSGSAIAKALNLGQSTVSDFIRNLTENVSVTNPVARMGGSLNGESPFGDPLSSTSTVPMASTEDRPETREDARS